MVEIFLGMLFFRAVIEADGGEKLIHKSRKDFFERGESALSILETASCIVSFFKWDMMAIAGGRAHRPGRELS